MNMLLAKEYKGQAGLLLYKFRRIYGIHKVEYGLCLLGNTNQLQQQQAVTGIILLA
jgi:hypothetical protein